MVVWRFVFHPDTISLKTLENFHNFKKRKLFYEVELGVVSRCSNGPKKAKATFLFTICGFSGFLGVEQNSLNINLPPIYNIF